MLATKQVKNTSSKSRWTEEENQWADNFNSPNTLDNTQEIDDAPSVKKFDNSVQIGGKKWLEKDKYNYSVNTDVGGGGWIYERAKTELGATPFGAALVLAFAAEEGGWGKGNSQSKTHNPFSLLQKADNGIPGTSHGHPIIYDTYEAGFTAWKSLIEQKYPDFLLIVKKNSATADEINKALKSGSHHVQGGYTNSDKGAALVGTLKYHVTFTVDRLITENSQDEAQIINYTRQKNEYKKQNPFANENWDPNLLIFESMINSFKMRIENRKTEIATLHTAYDNLTIKF